MKRTNNDMMISLRIPFDLLLKLDRLARREDRTRSDLLREIVEADERLREDAVV
jgi:predicted DNA-binding protein